MARTTSRNSDPIERLLQERQQYAVWLSRLDSTADTAPASVRVRVRADYQARLDAVITELKTHAVDVVEQLERHRDTRGELLTREAQAKEIMAEAEIRHAVGEYGDAKWQQLRGEAQKNLVSIREELTQLGEEIAELENVQSLISSPAIPETPAPSAPVAASAISVRPGEESSPIATVPEQSRTDASRTPVTHEAAPTPLEPVHQAPPTRESGPTQPQAARPASPLSPEPPKPPPATPGQTTARPAATVRPVKPKDVGPTPGRTLWFPSVKEEEINAGVDELAFLKSVSEDETTGPSPRRASGGSPRPVEAMTPSAPPPTPSITTNPHTLEASGPTSLPDNRPSGSTGARTLKCGECGTMNRPTEWYCERCGAELADL